MRVGATPPGSFSDDSDGDARAWPRVASTSRRDASDDAADLRDMLDAAEAARIGLINEVVPADALLPRALETAETIAANSPMAVQAVKRHISTGIADLARAGEPREQTLGDAVRASADFEEGIAAFREKRQPHYG